MTISGCLQGDVPRPLGWDWYTEFADAEQARQSQAPEALLVTVAMTMEDADEFMSQVVDDAAQDRSAVGRQLDLECFEALRRRRTLDPGAAVLGYEVVGAEYPLSLHSWHCHGYADDALEALGIRTNGHGLLATWQDAHRVRRWMLSCPPDQAPSPVPWTVVALARVEPGNP